MKKFFVCILLLPSVVHASPLIRKTARPPNYESPVSALDHFFTPNELFFERSHLAGIPQIDAASWSLSIGGDAAGKKISFSLAQLKDPKEFDQIEINALAVCSGNRRGLFDPHVPGVQWGHGAIGNAKWKGVRLKDILSKAGVKDGAIEVIFDGADIPVNEKTPDFKKSLPLARALDDSTLVAFSMTDSPLPEKQGFPARLVVPGWTATYWIKQLTNIEISSKPFEGFWMKTAYRIPVGKFPAVEASWPSQTTTTNTPITQIIVNSIITKSSLTKAGKDRKRLAVAGYAWDGGSGIAKVEVSSDKGKTWQNAVLEPENGKFSWRRFSYLFKPSQNKKLTALSRATNNLGQTQSDELILNPAGYHHNVPQEQPPQIKSNSYAGDSTILKSAAGHQKVSANCSTCHSLDYIEMNAGFMDYKGWEAEVNKMKKVYGAAISEEDTAVVIDYLAKNYGKL